MYLNDDLEKFRYAKKLVATERIGSSMWLAGMEHIEWVVENGPADLQMEAEIFLDKIHGDYDY